MALTKKQEEKIEELFQKAVSHGKSYVKNKYKQTEKRLYAYPILQKNIDRYKLDIEDVKSESFSHSHDIVIYTVGGAGEKRDIEDIRKAKILMLEQKIVRDEKEIREVNAALDVIKNDEYHKIINLAYFKNMTPDEIGKELNCDRATVFRNKKRLINMIITSFYGADAL